MNVYGACHARRWTNHVILNSVTSATDKWRKQHLLIIQTWYRIPVTVHVSCDTVLIRLSQAASPIFAQSLK